jgi:hypothetical protein
MLYSVPDPSPEPWEQQPGEPDEEYALYWVWYGRKCPDLAGDAARLAQERDWTSRANALGARVRGEPTQPLESIKRDAVWFLQEGMRRLCRELAGHNSAPSTRTLRDVQAILAAIDTANEYTRVSTVPLDQLPDSALEQIERASQILAKVS